VIGTREEWLAARTSLLAEEKEHTRRSDELARKRQALLDRTPQGRGADPEGGPRRHDEYHELTERSP